MSDHELIYSHDKDETRIKLVCNAGDGADCHMMVTETGWDDGPVLGRPQKRDYGSCIAVEHFNLDNIVPELEEAPGTTFTLARVPVKVSWDGDQFVWERLEEGVRDLDAAEDALRRFHGRQEALGRSVNSGMEVLLARALETALQRLGRGI